MKTLKLKNKLTFTFTHSTTARLEVRRGHYGLADLAIGRRGMTLPSLCITTLPTLGRDFKSVLGLTVYPASLLAASARLAKADVLAQSLTAPTTATNCS